jgi:hypothetical protein
LDNTNKLHRLYWVCRTSGKRFPAGVAFYNETAGDYRLKVDTFCQDKSVFLKPVSLHNEVIQFRVEAVVRRKDGPAQRVEIGMGEAEASKGFPIVMNIGPFDRSLVLEATA